MSTDQPQVSPRTFSLTKKICFSALIVVLLLGFIEAGFRLSGFSFRPHYSIYAENAWESHGVTQDPTLPWSWVPVPGALCHIGGSSDFHFNQLGYRGPIFQKMKAPGTLRIICMGDSGTMGWGVQDGETYCADLQNILERKCRQNVETINAGVFGFDSFQGVHQMKEKITALHPDVITLCYNWNDHADAIRVAKISGKYAWEKGVPARDKDLYHPQRYTEFIYVFSNLRIFQFLQYVGLRSAELSGVPEDQKRQSNAVLLRVPPDDYKENLEQLIDLARGAGITPILLTQALNPRKVEKPEMQIHARMQQQYNEMIREVAAGKNVLCVDPTSILETDPKYFSSNTHPTKAGHNRIAMLLANAICSMNL